MQRNRVSEVELGQRQYLRDRGYWQGSREQSHAFVLTPDVRPIDAHGQQELEEIARGIPPFLRAIEEMTQIVVASGARRGVEGQFRSFLRAGSAPKAFLNVQEQFSGMTDSGISAPTVKLDILATHHGFRLVEIDGWNPRTPAYYQLLVGLARFTAGQLQAREMPDPLEGTEFYPGVVPAIVHSLQVRGVSNLTVFVSKQEGFYQAIYEELAHLLRDKGIDVAIVREVDSGYVDAVRAWHADSMRVALALPPSWNGRDDGVLLTNGIDFSHRVLFPPKPVWSTKGLLALISTPPDWALELFDRVGYTEEERQALAQFIPRTWFPSVADDLPVIKRVHSSGSKGVSFPADGDASYLDTYRRCARGNGVFSHVFQQRVRPLDHRYRTYRNGTRFVRFANWRERFIVNVAGNVEIANALGTSVFDAYVTARRGSDNVHGQKDAIQCAGVRLLADED